MTNFIPPGGFACQPVTITKSLDALGCSGNVPANQDVSGRLRTSAPPNGALDGVLRLQQGTTVLGPYTLTGP